MTKPIVRDWTKETLILDLENAEGERFHFEIPPDANPNSVPTRSSSSPATSSKHPDPHGVYVLMKLPLL